MQMHLRLDSKSLDPRTSTYAIVPTSPPNQQHSTDKKLDHYDADSSFKQKKKLQHSRSTSLATIGGSSSSSNRRPGRRISTFTVLLVLAGVGVVGFFGVSRRSSGRNQPEVQFDHRHRIPVDFETTEVPPEWSCNPFKEPGRLLSDDKDASKNAWQPYDESCKPPRLMQGLMDSLKQARTEPKGNFRMQKKLKKNGRKEGGQLLEVDENGALFYPWLVNATILLQGDSMERLHLADFCDFVGGEATNISPNHTASAPIYRKPMPTILGPDGKETEASIRTKQDRIWLEDSWEARQASWHFTRPWTCDVKEYNATIISTFLWGLEDMEEVYHPEEFYHGPSTWLQRFQHVTLPMLSKLAAHYNRPQILSPNLIEISAGFWDLRAMTEEDFIQAGIPKPYPMDSEIPFGPIGKAREERWVRHATEVMKEVAKMFPGEKGIRDGPVMSWRTLHQPKRNNYTPFTRAAALDALARKTMHDLRVSSLATHPTFLSSILKRVHDTADSYFPREAIAELEKAQNQDEDETDYGFDERIRVNEIGKLLEGQQNHFRDYLHPSALPGSYVWGEIMLYELKRAYYRVVEKGLKDAPTLFEALRSLSTARFQLMTLEVNISSSSFISLNARRGSAPLALHGIHQPVLGGESGPLAVFTRAAFSRQAEARDRYRLLYVDTGYYGECSEEMQPLDMNLQKK
ncbi:uncharacterized protein JCM6883_001591 [Sporobolomyces salmoneus]|uniref:uncharacterized protein n=1 Tax=Sporobolomyces salmoneus TaxID=183962 RepID=UPI00317BFEA0